MQTCHALAARGHAVTLSVRADTTQPPRDPFRFYGLPPVPALTIARRDVAGPEPVRRMQYLGRAVLDASLLIAPDLVLTRDLGAASLLLTLPRGGRPAVVYESHGYAPAVRRPTRTPASPAPQRQVRPNRRVSKGGSGASGARADGYATITAALASELADRFGPRDVAVVPDGVALDAARTPPPRVSGAAPTVVYAGHLYPWKGVETLLDALHLLPGVQATVIGGHPGEPDLKRLQDRAAQLGVGDRVRFTGLVEPPRVASLLGEADVLVLPNVQTTISAAYTSPLKLFEYMAAGRPIVASDLPALREVVDDEQRGPGASRAGPTRWQPASPACSTTAASDTAWPPARDCWSRSTAGRSGRRDWNGVMDSSDDAASRVGPRLRESRNLNPELRTVGTSRTAN